MRFTLCASYLAIRRITAQARHRPKAGINMAPYTIGVDIGTTGLKAVVLDTEQGIVAHAERPHELLSPHPGWAEEIADQWWNTTASAIRQLLEVVPASAIAAVGVSGMVPAMVLLDASGQPLRPSIQ